METRPLSVSLTTVLAESVVKKDDLKIASMSISGNIRLKCTFKCSTALNVSIYSTTTIFKSHKIFAWKQERKLFLTDIMHVEPTFLVGLFVYLLIFISSIFKLPV
jgi:hypothetical protein